jgi:hypothetical protein
MVDLNQPAASALSRRVVLSGALGAVLGTALSTVAEGGLSGPALAQGAPEYDEGATP